MNRSEREALDVLQRHGGAVLPIDVEQIAEREGATVVRQDLDSNLSGMLFRDSGRRVIGINSSQPLTRQRFTVAHEIAHLLLHKGRPMIVDTSIRVNKRDHISSMATDTEEIEANAFAAELLMPRHLVLGEWEKLQRRGRASSGEAVLNELALRFGVSSQAMAYRLINLGIGIPP